jgi:hypothetical protein
MSTRLVVGVIRLLGLPTPDTPSHQAGGWLPLVLTCASGPERTLPLTNAPSSDSHDRAARRQIVPPLSNFRQKQTTMDN